MGYKSDREGLLTRYLAQKSQWDYHLGRTKEFILKTAESKKKGICVVLGSGWCLDIPLEKLAELFDNLILVDITHPSQIEQKARNFKNITLFETDITCCISELYEAYKRKSLSNFSNIPTLCNFGLPLDIDADYYVSPNVLSQLGSMVSEFFERKNVEAELRKKISAEIESAHIKMLPAGKSCLIADYSEECFDMRGNFLRKSERIFAPIPQGTHSEEWRWDFDLSGDYFIGEQVYFQVRGVAL